MSANCQHALFTEQENYYEEDHLLTKREFFRGEVFAMAGAAPKHLDIAGNIVVSLRAQLRGRPCRARQGTTVPRSSGDDRAALVRGRPCRARASDQRIRVEANTLITYPDVVVVCPPFEFNPQNKITLLDSTVIVEVLSDSTRAYDVDEKFDLLRELPSLRHYLLVEPNEIRVEHRFRGKMANGKPKFGRNAKMNSNCALSTVA